MLVSDLYCPSCRNAKNHKPQDNEVCWSCVAMGGAGNYKESKTNADRIRAMSDEELAEFLNGTDGDFLPTGEALTVSAGEKRWLDWLKQEADTDAESK